LSVWKPLTEGHDRLQPANLRKLIENSIYSLKTLENYEMAVLDEDEVGLIQARSGKSVVYWLVKAGKELLLESWPRVDSGEAHHVHFAVHESSLATAFQEHFKNVWNRVSPAHRDKARVTAWLEGLLEQLDAP
jgi:hypothetical protein